MTDLSLYEWKLCLHDMSIPSKELMQGVLAHSKQEEFRYFGVFLNWMAFNSNEIQYEDAIKYCRTILQLMFEVDQTHPSEDDYLLCLAYLMRGDRLGINAELISLYEKAITVEANEKTWQWMLREDLRVDLLAIYSMLNNFDQMRILLPTVKINATQYDELRIAIESSLRRR